MMTVRLAVMALLSVALSACYVVPASKSTRVVASTNNTAQNVNNNVNILQARLYPVNAEAQRMGAASATVSVDQVGHGRFNAYIGGENFSGDATREANSRRGTANGSAPSGRYIACNYAMNSTTIGKGECRMSSGAVFDMHISR